MSPIAMPLPLRFNRSARRLIILGVAMASVMLPGGTAVHATESRASPPAEGAPAVSEETLRSLVALATDRKRHPLKVSSGATFKKVED